MLSSENTKLAVPPFDIEAEQSVLGASLISREAAEQAARILQPEDFYRDEHKRIFKAVKELVKEDKEVDFITVKEKLKDTIEEVGGLTYLVSLAQSVPNIANTKYYAQIVKDLSIKRKLIDVSYKIFDLANEKEDSGVLIHRAKEMLDSINNTPHIKSTGERMLEILQKIDKRPPEIEIGIDKLNYLCRMYRGDLILIEAERKNGKTTFAMNLILNYLKKGYKVMLATFEIPADTRYIPLLARAFKKKRPFDKEEEMQQVVDFLSEFGENFYTLPENIYLEDFETSILDFIKEKKIDFVLVDYDQLVKTKRHFKTEERRVSTISRTFKRIALEGNCIVIMLSQINAQGVGRWSTEKENDASIVFRLEKDPVVNEIRVWVPYNRYNKSLSQDNAISLSVDWDKRIIGGEK